MAICQCAVCSRYYDDTRFVVCPYCNAQGNAMADEMKTEAYGDAVRSEEKTIGLYFQEQDFDPVTGWLVCVSGTVRGRSFELHMNRNFIGRDRMMDIAITDDPRLCRQKHLSVTYDRRSDHFYIKNENGSVFVNNSPVQKAMELKENDHLCTITEIKLSSHIVANVS